MPSYYEDPNTGERHEIKKTHRVRNFIVFPFLGFIGLAVVISVAQGGGEQPAPAGGAGTVQAPASGGDTATRLVVTGTGEASVGVTTQGTSMSTVSLPHVMDLPPGFASVTVTRGPSMESYMNGGTGDSGMVSCKITRGSEVVDEQTASGQFASVSCTKWR